MREALANLQAAVKLRTLLVLLVIHAGLGLAICALSRQTYAEGWTLTSSLFLAATLCLYGGVVLGVAFVLIPVLPWVRRLQNADHWSDRLIRDLPVILEQMPKIAATIQALVAAWNEARSGSSPRPAPITPPSSVGPGAV